MDPSKTSQIQLINRPRTMRKPINKKMVAYILEYSYVSTDKAAAREPYPSKAELHSNEGGNELVKRLNPIWQVRSNEL